jgi:alpha-1,3(6)-mannosylglycoprotein beta-1,6-N-acetyl-glucosaminyltransferase
MFVGEPYVYTIDAENLTEVELTIQRILAQPPPPPYIPYEFTCAGMLERVTAYLSHQRYCQPHQWLPVDSLVPHVSGPGQSCRDTCYDEGLVCEPELFHLLNTEEAFAKNGIECKSVWRGHSVHAPSLLSSDSHCSLQEDRLLLSCAGSKKDAHRLCPCRRYRKGQVALCLSCTE